MTRSFAITGAFGTLGLAVSRRLASQGFRLALIDAARAPEGLKSELPGALFLEGVDLTDEMAAKAAFEEVGRRYPPLGGLVNVAGGFRWEVFESGSLDTWERMHAINLRTALCATKAALPLLLAGTNSSVVCVSAAASGRAVAGMGAYAASKAGVSRLVESLADEFKDRGLRVNAVLPAIIDTPQNRIDMPDADFSKWVAPMQIATVIQFLLSDDASGVTGAAIAVSHRC